MTAFDKPPKFLAFDDFLPAPLVAGLLEHALASEASFEPAEVVGPDGSALRPESRQAGQSTAGLGQLKAPFSEAIHARFDEFVTGLGMQPFRIAYTETQLIAHGHDAFYKRHIDTMTGEPGISDATYRAISAVYYFHRQPKAFTGGEIAIHAFGSGTNTVEIEPLHNRLVVFPSIALHEVRKISCPSMAFADSRFAVNCWLHTERSKPRDDRAAGSAS